MRSHMKAGSIEVELPFEFKRKFDEYKKDPKGFL